jgi:hypothetical protein
MIDLQIRYNHVEIDFQHSSYIFNVEDYVLTPQITPQILAKHQPLKIILKRSMALM